MLMTLSFTCVFDRNDPANIDTALQSLKKCISKIKLWMLANELQLNGGKTELLEISKNLKSASSTSPLLQMRSDCVTTSVSAKNLGVTFDNNMVLTLMCIYLERQQISNYFELVESATISPGSHCHPCPLAH